MTDGRYQNDISSLPRLNAYNYENLFKVYQEDTSSPFFYNILNAISLPDDLDPTIYYEFTVPSNNISWTNLSFKMYGTIKLWWIICIANGIQNPILFPEAGTILKIIKPEYVREILSTIKQSQ